LLFTGGNDMFFENQAFKRISLLTAAFLIAGVVGTSAFPTGAYAAAQRKGIVVADALNVRSGPGLNYYIRNVIDEGKTVVIVETKDGWHKIKTGNNSYGWVSGDYISVNGKVGTTLPSSTTTVKSPSATKKTTKTTKKTTTKKTSKTTKKTIAKTTTTKKATKTTAKNNKKTVDLGHGIIRVTGYYTNLRQGKGSGYGVIRRLYRDTEAGIIEKNDSWYKVQLADSTVGWVSCKFVKAIGYKAPAASSLAKSTPEPSKIIVAVSSVNVRATASTKGKLIATIRMNEVYSYSEIQNGWYKIVTPSGESGYVKGDFVERFTQYAVKGGGKYIWPTQTATRISTYFGNTEGRVHNGIDIAAPGGSQIVAVASGTVVTNSYDPGGYGNLIVIEQSDGIRAYYGHMRKASFLEVGTKVKAGDTIGIVGTTGKSTGNHLHLEFRKGTQRIDPMKYFPALAKS
jgi:Membrane proteins related to metalloendopeptidases